jgi:myo-inositol-1(or 4)-monophosphatase
MARTALVNVMVQAVLKAGRGLARDFGEVENLQVSLKGPADFVSAADRRADETLIAELRKARPGYGFLTEENGAIEGSDPTHRWIIDPLDGTTNFLHGIPLFAISLGLERAGQMVAGVVYNPVMNELFVAERGGGAFLNDRRLRVSSRTELIDSVVATAMPHVGRNNAAYVGEFEKIIGKVAGVRRSGSSALDLAWLAAGRYDGLWQHGLQPWDLAAGLVIIREAGGFATDRKGGADIFGTGTVVAGNEAIHRRLLEIL